MKNSKNNFRIFIAALLALFTFGGATAAHATNKTGDATVPVKYGIAVNAGPVFQLSFTNEKEEQYEIKILEANEAIYTETVTGKELVRKFQFINNGSDEDVLKIQIKNISTKAVITYKINPTTTIEAETELVASL